MGPDRGTNLRFHCVARTHTGCRRKTNEDAFVSDTDVRLCAVVIDCDEDTGRAHKIERLMLS